MLKFAYEKAGAHSYFDDTAHERVCIVRKRFEYHNNWNKIRYRYQLQVDRVLRKEVMLA